MTRRDYACFAWNPISVTMGASLWDPAALRRVELDWTPGQIRNCSYSPVKHWLGIAAADQTRGDQVLAAFDLANRVTVRRCSFDVVLNHALFTDGERASLATLSPGVLAADLSVVALELGQQETIIDKALHQGSELSWFPDGRRIAYVSRDESVCVVDTESREVTALVDGASPAVSPDGRAIAYRHRGEVFIWDVATRRASAIHTGRITAPAALSWSPDGRCLTYGVTTGPVGKEMRFFLHQRDSGAEYEIPLRYQTGLILIPGRSGG